MVKAYRLTKGKHRVRTNDGVKVYRPGDIVELTDEQAISFKDRFVAEKVYSVDNELNKKILEAQEAAKQKIIKEHETEQANLAEKVKQDIEAEKVAQKKRIEDAAKAVELKAKQEAVEQAKKDAAAREEAKKVATVGENK